MPTVYITAPPESANEIARTLVDERLAACVNSLSYESVYRWEDSIQEDEELILLAKTTDEADVLDSFAKWRADVTDP